MPQLHRWGVAEHELHVERLAYINSQSISAPLSMKGTTAESLRSTDHCV